MGQSARCALTALWLAAASSGCDSQPDEASTEAGASGGKRNANPQVAQLATHMVNAVGASDQKAAVAVKFELAQRPEVGKPVDIALVFIPASRLDRVYARFMAADGLDVVKGGETEQFAHPVIGAPITHTLTVMPRRDGIFNVQAVVLTDSDSESVSRVFSIPLIAGSGIAEWSPKKVASRGDDAG